ncbi:MAG: MnhB domain-containing protein [Candidatus Thermoplasmatota archaeon]|nr:MnhB domain-containing protein [Candidatus Thermoplasmatota archaeon]
MRKIVASISFLILLAFLLFIAVKLHPFGEPEEREMDDYFIKGYYNETQNKVIGGAQNESGANNVVTAVVFDYRGFDTLGEATVLFSAVTGVAALFRRLRRGMMEEKRSEAERKEEGLSKIVKTITNIFYPLILIFGLYVILHGHLTPGGGFQGGAVVASAFALVAIAYGKLIVPKFLNKEKMSVVETSGLVGFIGLAFLGLTTTFFFNFLAVGRTPPLSWLSGTVPLWGPNPGALNTGGVLPFMNLAVGAEVLAGLGIIVLFMLVGLLPEEYEEQKEEEKK